jgi:ribosome-associated protein
MKKTNQEIVNLIGQAIYDKKGINILALDVTGLCSVTDFMVIAEGNVDRHVTAIAREVVDIMRENGMKAFHYDGFEFGDWVVLDFGGIMVHIFAPGERDKFCLEKLWPSCKLVDVQIDVSRPPVPQIMR